MNATQPIANDNGPNRRLFTGADFKGSRERLLKFLPAAQDLIQRFSTAPFRHNPDDPDYNFLAYQLCTLLDGEASNAHLRELQIESIARVLGCHPIHLFNAPRLPF